MPFTRASAIFLLVAFRLLVTETSSFAVKTPFFATSHKFRSCRSTPHSDGLAQIVTLYASSRLDYVHGYHAGNYADVVKHSILILLLERMTQKESPFMYVDTHAGAGSYPLDSPEALQMGEFKEGIARVLASELPLPDPLCKLVGMTTTGRNNFGCSFVYPGSPSIAKKFCRPQDSMLLFERSRDQFDLLCNNLRLQHDNSHQTNSSITTLNSDGYLGLAEYARNTQNLPRALVFMDPPYQFGSDANQIIRLIKHLQQHWKSARVVVWCPMSDSLQSKMNRMLSELKAVVSCDDILVVEMYPNDVIGTCIVMVNPPFGIEDDLQLSLPPIGQALRAEQPSFAIKWL